MQEFTDKIERQIRLLEDEELRLQSRVHELRGRLSGLRDALRIVSGETRPSQARRSIPSGSRVPDPSRSPGWAAALNFMERTHPDSCTIEDIENAMTAAGHQIARNTLRSVLSNAAKSGIVERVSVGRYRAVTHKEPPPASTEGDSDISSGDAGLPGELPSQNLPDGSTPSSSTGPLFRTPMR